VGTVGGIGEVGELELVGEEVVGEEEVGESEVGLSVVGFRVGTVGLKVGE